MTHVNTFRAMSILVVGSFFFFFLDWFIFGIQCVCESQSGLMDSVLVGSEGLAGKSSASIVQLIKEMSRSYNG